MIACSNFTSEKPLTVRENDRKYMEILQHVHEQIQDFLQVLVWFASLLTSTSKEPPKLQVNVRKHKTRENAQR